MILGLRLETGVTEDSVLRMGQPTVRRRRDTCVKLKRCSSCTPDKGHGVTWADYLGRGMASGSDEKCKKWKLSSKPPSCLPCGRVPSLRLPS